MLEFLHVFVHCAQLLAHKVSRSIGEFFMHEFVPAALEFIKMLEKIAQKLSTNENHENLQHLLYECFISSCSRDVIKFTASLIKIILGDKITVSWKVFDITIRDKRCCRKIKCANTSKPPRYQQKSRSIQRFLHFHLKTWSFSIGNPR